MKVIDETDKNLWLLITNVPFCEKWVAIVMCILNVLLPGVGTMIAACAGSGVVKKAQIVIGLLQFFTAYILIGWIWSIYWGYLLCVTAWGPGPTGTMNPVLPRKDAMGAGANYNAGGGFVGGQPAYGAMDNMNSGTMMGGRGAFASGGAGGPMGPRGGMQQDFS